MDDESDPGYGLGWAIAAFSFCVKIDALIAVGLSCGSEHTSTKHWQATAPIELPKVFQCFVMSNAKMLGLTLCFGPGFDR